MQQINLYRPIFRKQEKKFSAVAMLQAGLVIIAGVAVIYGVMAWQVRGMRAELANVNQRLAASKKQLEDVSRQLGMTGGVASVNERIAALEQQLNTRLRVREVLARGLFSNTVGYSPYFEALARQHVSGMWLTRFDIVGAGENMHLEGRAVDPAQVPRFVQRLAGEQVLSGKEFQVFTMARPKKEDDTAVEPQYLEFTLRTAPKELEKKS